MAFQNKDFTPKMTILGPIKRFFRLTIKYDVMKSRKISDNKKKTFREQFSVSLKLYCEGVKLELTFNFSWGSR